MASLLLLKSMIYGNAVQKAKKKKKVKKLIPSKENIKETPALCRICNTNIGDITIFDNIFHPNIPEDVELFSGIKLNASDSLSKVMCQSCLDLLNGCIRFRDMCQRNNKYMVEINIKTEYNDFDDDKNADDDDDDDSDSNLDSAKFSDDELFCNYCNKEIFDLDTYNKHLRECGKKHQSEVSRDDLKKSFLCDICGKTSASRANLAVHMSIHEPVFPFKCELCPYQGRTMDLLKVHKRSHLVDKPYKCTQCPKSCTTSSNLAKHMRHVHSTSRPFKCSFCDKAFSYQHDMKRHIRDIHLRQGTVECDVCFKKFNTRKILQGHRTKIHKIKGERHGRLPSYLQHQAEEDFIPQGSQVDNYTDET